jgi:hypothetical protein
MGVAGLDPRERFQLIDGDGAVTLINRSGASVRSLMAPMIQLWRRRKSYGD